MNWIITHVLPWVAGWYVYDGIKWVLRQPKLLRAQRGRLGQSQLPAPEHEGWYFNSKRQAWTFGELEVWHQVWCRDSHHGGVKCKLEVHSLIAAGGAMLTTDSVFISAYLGEITRNVALRAAQRSLEQENQKVIDRLDRESTGESRRRLRELSAADMLNKAARQEAGLIKQEETDADPRTERSRAGGEGKEGRPVPRVPPRRPGRVRGQAD